LNNADSLTLQVNEREIEMYLGRHSKELLQQIKALNEAQGIRLQSFQTKLEEALAHVDQLNIKAKAKLLQLGELQKPSREFDWENDTDDGNVYVVKHGFEDGNGTSE
jgi:hypothetical protein